MRRLVWVAVGAVGGILAYRRAQEAIADAREKGVVASAQQVGLSAAHALTTAKTMASGAKAATAAAVEARTAPASGPGAAAARVLATAPTTRSQQGA
jgi:hypothetical protein